MTRSSSGHALLLASFDQRALFDKTLRDEVENGPNPGYALRSGCVRSHQDGTSMSASGGCTRPKGQMQVAEITR